MTPIGRFRAEPLFHSDTEPSALSDVANNGHKTLRSLYLYDMMQPRRCHHCRSNTKH